MKETLFFPPPFDTEVAELDEERADFHLRRDRRVHQIGGVEN